MRRLRDVFYINAFPETNEIIYYGMELKEFLNYAPIEINHLLLLEAEYFGRGFSSRKKFEIVDKEEMDDFLKEHVYSYGNFCWVDFNQKENVEELEPMEIAELLYLGHMFKPLKSPFFERIDNRYAYLAHDDGWYCKLYCRYLDDFKEIIANKVIGMVSTSKRRKIYAFSEELKQVLFSLAVDGLLIDFSNTLRSSNSIEIPIYTIGKFIDMDEMYNGLRRHIGRSRYSAKLVHKNKKWSIDYEIHR
ncbi:hypothetical protein B0I26_1464 [Anoxybacillus vitaminiphilus]|uniref:Uncharacterized protein n=1 Tax=Paranoxybacillus vitaminiphilus TaxID=581036 RepID=A0A327XZ20_9BACL|nr:hypothetical protein [Anoxybacillus vitaminiphilus]RAK13854.1 hypothetical protein B0I26_1464 [Anoxybacillus vitaminiphilus]